MFNSIFNFIIYHTPIFYLIQSVWRDEAFSYFMARPNVIKIITNTAHDFNPPLYYLLLHLWMKIANHSDIGLRILSLFPHLVGTYVTYLLARKLADKKMAFWAAAFFMFNPMLLFYAFEMRMYSFYAFFTLLSLYFFYIQNWKWYTISSVLGLYTHTFFMMVITSYVVYLKLAKRLDKKSLFNTLKPLIYFLPWVPVIGIQFMSSKDSWMYPVDFQLITSSLGNLLTNYQGTPGNLWKMTRYVSLFVLLFSALSLREKRKKPMLFITPIFLPLILVLGYSIISRPIYVNRYMIFVTVFETFSLFLGMVSIKNNFLRHFFMAGLLVFFILFNIYISPFHKKTDFRSTFMEINKMASTEDIVYAKTPIGFLESAYYYKNPKNVLIYNPNSITIPNYIGVTVLFPDVSRSVFPPSLKTFLVNDDASYQIIISN